MDNFKNFGEALAWMMESPENVAVGCAGHSCCLRYRFDNGELQYQSGENWFVNSHELSRLTADSWSRAPREPLEFRADAYVAGSALELDHKRLAQFCNDANNGTKFELILKEKN